MRLKIRLSGDSYRIEYTMPGGGYWRRALVAVLRQTKELSSPRELAKVAEWRRRNPNAYYDLRVETGTPDWIPQLFR